MRVSEISLVEEEKSFIISARIESKAFDPFSLWYRFPNSFKPYVNTNNGDPYVAALLLPSMKVRENLEIAAPISNKLFQSSDLIQDYYQTLKGNFSKIAVQATKKQSLSSENQSSNNGLFFSLGVDSFYTLLNNHRVSDRGSERITHLILVEGFDIRAKKGNSQLFPIVLNNTAEVARQFDVAVIPVSTNIRELSSDRVSLPWQDYYGAALASVGLFLDSFFDNFNIASGLTLDELFPHGSHPYLDVLWSTETLAFVHDGVEVLRFDKLASIAETPIALETLRVCYENSDGVYNCGRCTKCVRTMIGLWIHGALESSQTFPPTINPNVFRSLSFKNKRTIRRFRYLDRKLEGSGAPFKGELSSLLRRENVLWWPRKMAVEIILSARRLAKYIKNVGEKFGFNILDFFQKRRKS